MSGYRCDDEDEDCGSCGCVGACEWADEQAEDEAEREWRMVEEDQFLYGIPIRADASIDPGTAELRDGKTVIARIVGLDAFTGGCAASEGVS